MESFSFKYPATKSVAGRAHTGVLGSGDLEILLEPTAFNETEFVVRTASDGFQEIWKRVFDRFVALNDISAKIILNDFGATPGVVSLRLSQVLELANQKIN
ncbi:malonate decarboxylase acyl carrier protein [Chryseobacterium carnipullorum]|uniref:Malonate decarboxylase acyl carrier protein n=1 Tax=Chryseobacterium carnipullorum TaxID=1124835 RepID=A0A376DRY6_CHRCU|nr:malonate decarboxylase acyl carrier protein [Chryseobacterium carnipullorum]AZA49472.1 malonate decarboxylase acyl carrier protein [Chryseobacterium carnipullorum]AZA64365.1 malonate decarboxylase acyl carrier protein [Chryseobacterium carnipullorum]STC94418.1 Malonate decarboxylase subunit delta [Chryseobacterium carnipullorum]